MLPFKLSDSFTNRFRTSWTVGVPESFKPYDYQVECSCWRLLAPVGLIQPPSLLFLPITIYRYSTDNQIACLFHRVLISAIARVLWIPSLPPVGTHVFDVKVDHPISSHLLCPSMGWQETV